jgi:YD repeat-containing protein
LNYDYENSNNQLTRIRGGPNLIQFYYDNAGNIVNKDDNGLIHYDYDCENRLVKVEIGDLVIEYDYDWKGRRVLMRDYDENKKIIYLYNTNGDIIYEKKESI